MTARPSSTVPVRAPAPSPEDLLDLAQLLAGAWSDEPGPAQLVGVTTTAATASGAPTDGAAPSLEVVLADLPADDPVGALLGLEAPPRFGAVGVVAPARAHALQGDGPAGPATFVHLVAVDGSTATVLERPGHPPVELDAGEPGGGRVDDLCRRALGLPTPPPPCGLGAHLVDLWLARLAAVALEQPGLDWVEAAAHHPLRELARSARPAHLAAATAAIAGVPGWEGYRRAIADGRGPGVGSIGAVEAAWLDAGSFARCVLGEAVPWPTALDHLEALLPHATSTLVAATVRLSPPGPLLGGADGAPCPSTGPGPDDGPMGG